MPNKKSSAPIRVESLKHKDKRANIPTEELRDFVADEEFAQGSSAGSGIRCFRDSNDKRMI